MIIMETNVILVEPQNAKKVKKILESNSFLDKHFRMKKGVDNLIAIPITESCFQSFHHQQQKSSDHDCNNNDWTNYVYDITTRQCPFSTSVMGNGNCQPLSVNTDNKNYPDNGDKSGRKKGMIPEVKSLPLVQVALLESIMEFRSETMSNPMNDNKTIISSIQKLGNKICPKKLEKLGQNDALVIPPGAFLSFNDHQENINEASNGEFYTFLKSTLVLSTNENETDIHKDSNDTSDDSDEKITITINKFMNEIFWKKLASLHRCKRVVQRGDIDPDSKIRKPSNHSILYPIMATVVGEGPTSPGWITIKEQNILQSFDLTKVMFSRGNISEKIRFGKLLSSSGNINIINRDNKVDDIKKEIKNINGSILTVLDMYAGIGYYTLPALLKSNNRVQHVICCEWSPYALFALEYNLKQNKIPEEKYTILRGDCRETIPNQSWFRSNKTNNHNNTTDEKKEEEERRIALSMHHKIDHVSLGLLPSSEGGWKIAVLSLRNDYGGYLHVHANVREDETNTWVKWLCHTLLKYLQEEGEEEEEPIRKSWVVVCTHIEKVKSFAPKVNHLVADVFVGPFESDRYLDDIKEAISLKRIEDEDVKTIQSRAFVVSRSSSASDDIGKITQVHDCTDANVIVTPSCALSPDGVLHQEWMR